MELNQVKRMAAELLGVGISKVRIVNVEKSLQSMTKDDVRGLIASGAVEKRKAKQPSRAKARLRDSKKEKGLRTGTGRIRKRVASKQPWMNKTRAMRKKLSELKPGLVPKAYGKLRRMIKGNYFRDKKHLQLFIKEKKLGQEKGL